MVSGRERERSRINNAPRSPLSSSDEADYPTREIIICGVVSKQRVPLSSSDESNNNNNNSDRKMHKVMKQAVMVILVVH